MRKFLIPKGSHKYLYEIQDLSMTPKELEKNPEIRIGLKNKTTGEVKFFKYKELQLDYRKGNND